MFDFLRNLTKSEEEKQREALNAYLDGELSGRTRERFDEQLAQDPALQAELAELQQIKRGLQTLPRLRAPRNFTLDPAVYGRPARQPAFQLYPALRTATVLAAFFFILTLALDLYLPQQGLLPAPGGEAEVAMVEDMAEVEVEAVEEESMALSEAPEMTQMVTGEAGEPMAEEMRLEEEAEEIEPPGTMTAEDEAVEEAMPAAAADEVPAAESDTAAAAAAAAAGEVEAEDEMADAALPEEEAAGEGEAELMAPQPTPGSFDEGARQIPETEALADGGGEELMSRPVDVEEQANLEGQAETAAKEPVAEPSWLLVAELVLGAAFLLLLISVFFIRRRIII